MTYQEYDYSSEALTSDHAYVFNQEELNIWKKGYYLMGWGVQTSDGTYNPEHIISCGEPIRSVFDIYGNQVVLVPVWKARVYNIFYSVPAELLVHGNRDSYTIDDDVVLENCTISGVEYNWVYSGSNEICTGWNSGYQTGDIYLGIEGLYTIEYDIGEADVIPNNPSYYFAGDTITLYAPERNGYNFLGWYLWDNEFIGSGEEVVWTPDTEFKDIYLTAKWSSPLINSIMNRTESGTVAVTGAITDYELQEIRFALKELYRINPEIQISLDFSEATPGCSNGLSASFYECHALSGITLSSVFTWIESFTGTQLSTITIPDSIYWIEKEAFSNCDSLTSVTFESGSAWDVGGVDHTITINVSDYSPEQLAVLLTQDYCSAYWFRN